MAAPKIIVVGGGLAGLAAVIKIAEAGGTVDLFSIVPVKRSHSVCAQGGINAAKNLKGEGDTILHMPAPGASLPPAGTTVQAEIDWERRHKLMRVTLNSRTVSS